MTNIKVLGVEIEFYGSRKDNSPSGIAWTGYCVMLQSALSGQDSKQVAEFILFDFDPSGLKRNMRVQGTVIIYMM